MMAVPDCKVRQKQQVLSGVSDILAEVLEENRPCTRAARSPADISPGQTVGWVVSGEQLHTVTHPADTPR